MPELPPPSLKSQVGRYMQLSAIWASVSAVFGTSCAVITHNLCGSQTLGARVRGPPLTT